VDSKQNKIGDCRILRGKPAFSLLEVIAALVILALVSSSVLVVINRCMSSSADSALCMQAFEVARENMEKLLASDSVSEIAEYGTSDKYPQIQWQRVVEAFYEPVTSRMWVQATCSAEYADTAGQQQTVELTHWLTDLTKEQLLEIIKQEKERPSDPNEPSEPNVPSEPNRPEPEPDRPEPEPGVDCDTLPFCESVLCHLKAGTPGKPTFDELIRYVNECMER